MAARGEKNLPLTDAEVAIKLKQKEAKRHEQISQAREAISDSTKDG